MKQRFAPERNGEPRKKNFERTLDEFEKKNKVLGEKFFYLRKKFLDPETVEKLVKGTDVDEGCVNRWFQNKKFHEKMQISLTHQIKDNWEEVMGKESKSSTTDETQRPLMAAKFLKDGYIPKFRQRFKHQDFDRQRKAVKKMEEDFLDKQIEKLTMREMRDLAKIYFSEKDFNDFMNQTNLLPASQEMIKKVYMNLEALAERKDLQNLLDYDKSMKRENPDYLKEPKTFLTPNFRLLEEHGLINYYFSTEEGKKNGGKSTYKLGMSDIMRLREDEEFHKYKELSATIALKGFREDWNENYPWINQHLSAEQLKIFEEFRDLRKIPNEEDIEKLTEQLNINKFNILKFFKDELQQLSISFYLSVQCHSDDIDKNKEKYLEKLKEADYDLDEFLRLTLGMEGCKAALEFFYHNERIEFEVRSSCNEAVDLETWYRIQNFYIDNCII